MGRAVPKERLKCGAVLPVTFADLEEAYSRGHTSQTSVCENCICRARAGLLRSILPINVHLPHGVSVYDSTTHLADQSFRTHYIFARNSHG